MEKEEKANEYVSYKKLLIYGAKNSGKTTVAKSFNDINSFEIDEEINGKKYNKFYNYFIFLNRG